MQDDSVDTLPDLTGLSSDDWLAELEDYAEEAGYYEPLGDSHSVVFVDRGPVLLVTFETVADARADVRRALPLGLRMSEGTGYSQLAILAKSHRWFRDPSVYGYFDRLVDDGFFEDFDRVVFYGAAMCGYAAAAFSVAAPGATVIAVSPQATLDPRIAEWDHRFTGMRSVSFTDRYGYAPDMLEAAERAYVLYDPDEDEDAMHAALFYRRNVARLRCRGFGRRLAGDLAAMEILKPILKAACEGRFSEAEFHRMFRRRRNYLPYLRKLLRRVDDDGRETLARMLCRNVTGRMRAPLFRRRLQSLDAGPGSLNEPAQ